MIEGYKGYNLALLLQVGYKLEIPFREVHGTKNENVEQKVKVGQDYILYIPCLLRIAWYGGLLLMYLFIPRKSKKP